MTLRHVSKFHSRKITLRTVTKSDNPDRFLKKNNKRQKINGKKWIILWEKYDTLLS